MRQFIKWISIIAGCLVALVLVIYIALALFLDSYLISVLEKK
jgi:hypothetical protein